MRRRSRPSVHVRPTPCRPTGQTGQDGRRTKNRLGLPQAVSRRDGRPDRCPQIAPCRHRLMVLSYLSASFFVKVKKAKKKTPWLPPSAPLASVVVGIVPGKRFGIIGVARSAGQLFLSWDVESVDFSLNEVIA